MRTDLCGAESTEERFESLRPQGPVVVRLDWWLADCWVLWASCAQAVAGRWPGTPLTLAPGKLQQGRSEMGGGRWEMRDGKWEAGGGRWEMGSGRFIILFIIFHGFSWIFINFHFFSWILMDSYKIL